MKKSILAAIAASIFLAAGANAACVGRLTATTTNAVLINGTVNAISVGGSRNAGLKGSFYFNVKGTDGLIVQVQRTDGVCVDGLFVVEANDSSRDLFFQQVQAAKSKASGIAFVAIDDPSWPGQGQGVVVNLQQK